MAQKRYKITPAEAAREILRRDRAKESLVDYSKAIIIPGKPIDDTLEPDEWVFYPVETDIAKHHFLIMSACQDVFDDKIKNLMLLFPPGSAKSTYASVVFPTWAMGRNPGTQIILASYGSDLAKKHGRRARQIVDSQDYMAVFETSLSPNTKAADYWAVENSSEYMSCGILSGITGNRADGIVLDDPIKGRAEADSETIRERTWEAYQDDLLTRLKPGGWQILIQTRWHEDDVSGRILPEDYNGESGIFKSRVNGEQWTVLCCPAECERKDDPLGREIGETLWPEWFKDNHFDKFKAVARTWSALFQQRPSPDQGTFFQREWFELYKIGEHPVHIHLYGSSDYAVSEEEGDFTEHGVFGIDHQSDIWILDWWYKQTTADVWIESMLDMVKKWKPFTWFGEGGVIRKAIEPFLTRRMWQRSDYVTLEWINPIKDKPTRARGAQAWASQSKIHIPDCPWGHRLLDQLVKFPAGSYDDAVDTLSLVGMALDQAHPSIIPPKHEKLTPQDRRILELYKGNKDTYADYAMYQQREAMREIGYNPNDGEEYGDLIDTV